MNPPQFYCDNSLCGIRVYVHKNAPQSVHDWFKIISVWGGADKSGENYFSYELRNSHVWIKETNLSGIAS